MKGVGFLLLFVVLALCATPAESRNVIVFGRTSNLRAAVCDALASTVNCFDGGNTPFFTINEYFDYVPPVDDVILLNVQGTVGLENFVTATPGNLLLEGRASNDWFYRDSAAPPSGLKTVLATTTINKPASSAITFERPLPPPRSRDLDPGFFAPYYYLPVSNTFFVYGGINPSLCIIPATFNNGANAAIIATPWNYGYVYSFLFNFVTSTTLNQDTKTLLNSVFTSIGNVPVYLLSDGAVVDDSYPFGSFISLYAFFNANTYPVNTINNAYSFYSWSFLNDPTSVMVLPEPQNGPFEPNEELYSLIESFILSGGVGIVFNSASNQYEFFNDIFGTNYIVGDGNGLISSQTSSPDASNPLYTCLTPTLAANNAMWTIQGEGNSVECFYKTPDGACSILKSTRGAGCVFYFAYDFYDASPNGSQDGGWLQLLDRIVSVGDRCQSVSPATPSPTPSVSPSRAAPSITPTSSVTRSFTSTPSPSRSFSQTASRTAPPTPTKSGSRSITPTPTRSPSISSTSSPSKSSSPSISNSKTASGSVSATKTPSSSVSPTRSPSSTISLSRTSSSSITATPSLSQSNTVTKSPSGSVSPSRSNTPSITTSPSTTLSISSSPTLSQTKTPTSTLTLTATGTPSITSPPSITPSPSISKTSTHTPTTSKTLTGSRTPSKSDIIPPKPTEKPTSSTTRSVSKTPSPSTSTSRSSTPTKSPTRSASPSRTESASVSPSRTPSISVSQSFDPKGPPSETMTPSRSPTMSRSSTQSPTGSRTSTRSVSETPTFTSTPTGTPTSSPTGTGTRTNTGTPSPTSTMTPSETASRTGTSSHSSTKTISPSISSSPTRALPSIVIFLPSSSPSPPPFDINTSQSSELDPIDPEDDGNANNGDGNGDNNGNGNGDNNGNNNNNGNNGNGNNGNNGGVIQVSPAPIINCASQNADNRGQGCDFVPQTVNVPPTTNGEQSVVLTNGQGSVGIVVIPNSAIPGAGSVSIQPRTISDPNVDSKDVISAVVDITLTDAAGNDITEVDSDVSICLSVDSNEKKSDLCLGYLDEKKDPPKWKCQDECLEDPSYETDENLLCGKTDHFTSFAILLGQTSDNPCGATTTERVVQWLSLAVVLLGLIVVLIGAVIVELRIRYRIHQKNTLDSKHASAINSLEHRDTESTRLM